MSETALDSFQTFLDHADEISPINELHVVFERGTIVRVTSKDIADTFESPFNERYVNDWPLEVLSDPDDEFEYIIMLNVKNYSAACDMFDRAHVRAAYVILLNAGYLEPGPEATRTANHIGNTTYLIKYPFSGNDTDLISKKILNIVECDNIGDSSANAAVTLGGEYRRLDWMFPKIKTIIGKIDPNILPQ